MEKRRKSCKIRIGNLTIGGDCPVAVQSMTNTKTHKVEETVQQIKELEEIGCDLVRVAVPDQESVDALIPIKKRIKIPLIADVHFNWRLALAAIDNGADKIRINPGNIGDLDRVKEIVAKAKKKKIPVRIGVNSGSLHKKYHDLAETEPAEALVKSAVEFIGFFEEQDFDDIVLSVKSSSVQITIEAYEKLAALVDYPLHLGVTEAGTVLSGSVKSAVGLGILLYQGIGDTIRVSLTAGPVQEVRVANEILRALNLRNVGPELISCPTCGRCEVELISVAETVEKLLFSYRVPLKVAIMGCVVNGPGEAREADVGIAMGKKSGVLFAKGEPIRKVPEGEFVDSLLGEVEKLAREYKGPMSND
jgi:(E)-4-hydroxy-3-methylbut-2-enyl-diphosphate synthase